MHVVGLRFHFRVPNVQSDLLALIVAPCRVSLIADSLSKVVYRKVEPSTGSVVG